jgi:hypothetical protein
MGLREIFTARRRPAPARLDALFALTNAALTLETSMDMRPTGRGGVCFRAFEGPAFDQTMRDVVALLDNDDDPDVELVTDQFGYAWLVAQQQQVSDLVTDLHAVNTSLEAQGFGSGLLCSLVGFRDPSGRSLGLVYLYKQGTFYPFAPVAGASQQRDNLLEIQVSGLLASELPVERDRGRWMALWDAPAL